MVWRKTLQHLLYHAHRDAARLAFDRGESLVELRNMTEHLDHIYIHSIASAGMMFSINLRLLWHFVNENSC